MAFVYWITNDTSATPLSNGYVGITSSVVVKRIKAHHSAYSQFIKGKNAGCKKLYSEVKSLGGWDKVQVITLCEAELGYCLILENKLRPEPNVGWNTRVGGDCHVMYKREVSAETKAKLAEVRSTWVLSEEAKQRLSISRKKDGNPMYGTLPWLNPSRNPDSKQTWLFADEVYNLWSVNKQGVKVLSRSFTELNYWTVDSMIRKFRNGWIPHHDNDWITYKDDYDRKTS